MPRPAPHLDNAPLAAPPPAAAWRLLGFLGPVAVLTLAALVVALRAMPLTGGARLIFATAIAINVALLALSSWSAVLGAAAKVRRRAGHRWNRSTIH
jgi:hypothetical protein